MITTVYCPVCEEPNKEVETMDINYVSNMVIVSLELECGHELELRMAGEMQG